METTLDKKANKLYRELFFYIEMKEITSKKLDLYLNYLSDLEKLKTEENRIKVICANGILNIKCECKWDE